MQSPATREAFPGKKGDFNFFDQMMRENGPTCPRLSAIWERVFPRSDAQAQEWLKKTMGKVPVTATVPQQSKPVPNIVGKAMAVLSSYKKT